MWELMPRVQLAQSIIQRWKSTLQQNTAALLAAQLKFYADVAQLHARFVSWLSK